MKLLKVIVLSIIVLPAVCQDDTYLLQQLKHHKDEVEALDFSPSNEFLATGGLDKALYIYSTHENVVQYENKSLYYAVKDVVFFGNSKLFLTAGNDIRLIDFQDNTVSLFEGNSTEFWSLNYAIERNKITGGSYDKKIRVWDVGKSQVDIILEGHKTSVLSVCFSPDEKYIVTGSRDKAIKVWNAKTGALMKTFDKHSDNIFDVEFHPNAKYFASASADKTIRLWDIETGEVVKTYAGNNAAIMDIAFSPNGYFLYSASYDGLVVIYEVSTGQKLYSYNLHEGAVNAIAVSKDGELLASGGADGVVNIWRSAKYIAVDLFFKDQFNKKLNSNPLLEAKRKGESKEDYETRKGDAKRVEAQILDEVFLLYEDQVKHKTIP